MMIQSAVRKWKIALAGLGLLAVAVGVTAAYGQPFVLKDGDTVVFYGDSITAQRLYSKDVEEFLLTRYPALHVRFVNAGVPGDTVNGGYAGTMGASAARCCAVSSGNDYGDAGYERRWVGIRRAGERAEL